MRSSGSAVFTRKNPFPLDPPMQRSHYSPSRAKKIPKQQKRLALSPVRFAEPSSPPHRPEKLYLRTEKQVFNEKSHNVLLHPPFSAEPQLSFSESWPSSDLSGSTDHTDSPAAEMQPKAMRDIVAPANIEQKEPSVLAKYIERFRFGKPQSREERQRQTNEEEEDQPFWWLSESPPSGSTPKQTSEKSIREGNELMNDDPAGNQSPISKPRHDEITLSSDRHGIDLSMLTLSESSHCDHEDPEIQQLQERANRLLQRSEHSVSSDSVPISSEGLGCSDFSSPVSTEEPVRRPLLSTLTGSTNMVLEPILCEGTSFPPAVGPDGSGVRREDDILFQWRLRRKMEQARQWCQEAPSHNSVLHIPLSHTVVPNQAHHSTLNSMTHQRANLSFTPVTVSSLDPPVPQSSFTISSPGISRLQSDVIQEQLDPDFQANLLPQRSRKTVKNHETPSAQPKPEKPIKTQVKVPETTAEHRRIQRSSSPSPQTSDSTEERWPVQQNKKDTAVKEKTRRCDEKSVLSSRKKRSERRSSERGSSPMRFRHARGHEGVNRKSKEPSEKDRWHKEGQSSTRARESGNRAPPPSPIHNTLGQVVSEVLFAGSDSPAQCKTASSSDSQIYTPPPPPQSSAASCSGVQQPLEVIDQLMQDAEDSDGTEFEDDALLQVLRQQRKWVKEQLCEVDVMLQQL